MYLKWAVSDDYPTGLWLQYDYDKSPDHLLFRQGRRLTKVKGPLLFTTASKNAGERLRKYDYLMSDATELVSKRFAELIDRVAPRACQFFPADLIAGTAKVDGYFVVNVAVRCSCIDMKKSKYKPMLKGEPGPPWDFSKYVLVPGCLGSHHLARPEEDTELVIVDDVFAEACRGANIRGVDFEPFK